MVRAGPAPGGPGGAEPRPAWPPLLVLLSGAVVLVLVGFDAPVRAVPVLAYIAVVPGLAWVRLLPVRDRLTIVLLAVGLSLALGTVVAQAMVNVRRWSPVLGLSSLVALASIAALTELSRGHRPGAERRRRAGSRPGGGPR